VPEKKELQGRFDLAFTSTSFNTALPTAHPIPAAIEYFSRRPRGGAASSARATHITQRGKGPKTAPNPEHIPDRYRPLLAWYRDWCSAALKSAEGDAPLLSLAGSGKLLWADEDVDE